MILSTGVHTAFHIQAWTMRHVSRAEIVAWPCSILACLDARKNVELVDGAMMIVKVLHRHYI